jgi:Na+/H+ antiporter NhaA
MTAIAKSLSSAIPATSSNFEKLETVALFCGAGLVVSLFLAFCGLDISVGIF